MISRDVVFDEKSMTKAFREDKCQAAESNNSNSRSAVQVEFDELESQPEEESHGSDEELDNTRIERSKRNKRPPVRYGFDDLVSYALITSSEDPSTFQEAIDSSEKGQVDGSYGGRNGVFEQEQDLRVNRTSKREETYRLQVGIQKEKSSIEKGRGKIQGTISSKRIFTEA